MFHRDLSPETLLVDRQGLVKMVDLGLAKTPEAALTEAAFPVHPKANNPPGGRFTARHSSNNPTQHFDRHARLYGPGACRHSHMGRSSH